jgi:hypothetical protein
MKQFHEAKTRAARRRAGVLVISAAVLWWHEWMPALIVVAFLAWALLHRRYQGSRREAFMRVRSRVWPPPTLVLVALIVAGTAVYGLSRISMEARILPIALNVVAFGMLVVGWARVVSLPSRRTPVDAFATKGGRA